MGYCTETIKRILAKHGKGEINPDAVEAWMRVEHGTLDGLSAEEFAYDVAVAVACIERVGPEKTNSLMRSMGYRGTVNIREVV